MAATAVFLLLATAASCILSAPTDGAAPSSPTVPLPTPAQLRLVQRGYQQQHEDGGGSDVVLPPMGSARLPGLTMFQHFGPCTFMTTGEGCSPNSKNCTCQWDIQNPLWHHGGSRAYPQSVAPASSFNPVDLDTDNWMEAALQLGASQVCLTVRHVDGFALWPTRANNYSVAASPWRAGKGDVVKDFVASARRFGISPCFYIILGFDVFSNQSGVSGAEYLAQQETALTELLTDYGPIDRLWWDNYAIGCCQPVTHAGFFCEGGGTQARNVTTSHCPNWSRMIDSVRRLSPQTAIVPGPDGCLVNGERQGGTYPLFNSGPPTGGSYSCGGAKQGQFAQGRANTFVVSESDFSFVTGNWFWNPGITFMKASDLWSQFILKYGQGAAFILNVPPNASGVVPEEYLEQLRIFNHTRMTTYGKAVVELTKPVTAPCSELSFVVPMEPTQKFDQMVSMEDLEQGQQITGHTIEVLELGQTWRQLTLENGHGATVGARVVEWGLGTVHGVTGLRWNCSKSLTQRPVTVARFAAFLGSDTGLKTGDSTGKPKPYTYKVH